VVPFLAGILASAVADGLKERRRLRDDALADIIVYDDERLDSGPQDRPWNYPGGEMHPARQAAGRLLHGTD
jgi:hypothetical protein